MEADWEFEIGGDAPVIEACWQGFVDLRIQPEKARELPECRVLPGLAGALTRLNASDSPVWTSKIDIFNPGSVDPYELDSSAEQAVHAIACYIDLLVRDKRIWSSPDDAETSCRQICSILKPIELRQCRIDLVVRRAVVASTNGFGATAYLTACGATEMDASNRLELLLDTFTNALTPKN